jgi:streptomycin 6-kinase
VDERRAGDVLRAFDGRGAVRLHAHDDGALLLERLRPGVPLDRAGELSDDDATGILAGVIRSFPACEPPPGVPTARALGSAFARADVWTNRIPPALVSDAQRVYAALCDSQARVRLLHGDLHHGNVLLDEERGWLAIDPKGVIGELEYEVGAALRNPIAKPEIFTDPAVITRRVDHFVRALDLDASRVLGWAFAQAVLAAIWLLEDGQALEPDHSWLTFADAVRPMLGQCGH